MHLQILGKKWSFSLTTSVRIKPKKKHTSSKCMLIWWEEKKNTHLWIRTTYDLLNWILLTETSSAFSIQTLYYICQHSTSCCIGSLYVSLCYGFQVLVFVFVYSYIVLLRFLQMFNILINRTVTLFRQTAWQFLPKNHTQKKNTNIWPSLRQTLSKFVFEKPDVDCTWSMEKSMNEWKNSKMKTYFNKCINGFGIA